MNEKYKFIVVEGPIGVGKTTLARKLANNLNSELLLEKFLENPFLEKFYKDIDKYALSTQLHFLLQRKADLSKLDSVVSINKNYVSDYFINKDKLFAKTVVHRQGLGRE